ncbi:hypothetical protein FRACYDRAFT_231975 [Fragilariopsis cylindrus CCMP1102]|uniref:Uncharacterized protein n=1 Tax=Fragilariopsis cylindrus CCMP1102 TaxID=635003 RepID=A0A1E7FUK3_9STRA|nr:hypothetical protein FRACYDRAFT_231975 [Fragilariopsis cylindrus CCMP1102]|eukprot:OEU21829.1 hypothetical protein FRACYDRAFT_231975 [Fragilariopsis cylindrus CCMP1102]
MTTTNLLTSTLPKWFPVSPAKRRLDYDNDDNYQSYLVDSDGNSYEPYAMAWRYLGMYIDCDVQQEYNNDGDYDGSDVYRNRQRQRRTTTNTNTNTKQRNLSGSGSNDGDDCSRKVLWAAYVDPGYRGDSIGEYQFYNRFEETWDKSTCQTGRCAKMDCHSSKSRFKLIGVFKEADGLTDWAEQLFKHEGYCVWNDNANANTDDDNEEGNDDGNSVYRHLRPQGEGNITDSLYTDEDCTQKSYMSFADYIIKWYTNYYYDSDKGQQVAEKWQANTVRWNELMTDYKVCQPCRAYTKTPTYDDDVDRLRFLRRLDDNDDGEGDEEQYGYNCYDDAGYRNCNQCHKFETKTDMEAATVSDLERASAQGTILAIKVDGVTYGKGGIDWHDVELETQAGIFVLVAVAVLGMIFLLVRFFGWKSISEFFCTPVRISRRRRRRRLKNKSLIETFVIDSTNTNTDNNDDSNSSEEKPWSIEMVDELSKEREVIEKQRREIEQMKLELDQQYTIREMEWETNQRELNEYKKKRKESSNFPPESIEVDAGKDDDREEETEGQLTENECAMSETNSFVTAEASEEKTDDERQQDNQQEQDHDTKEKCMERESKINKKIGAVVVVFNEGRKEEHQQESCEVVVEEQEQVDSDNVEHAREQQQQEQGTEEECTEGENSKAIVAEIQEQEQEQEQEQLDCDNGEQTQRQEQQQENQVQGLEQAEEREGEKEGVVISNDIDELIKEEKEEEIPIHNHEII